MLQFLLPHVSFLFTNTYLLYLGMSFLEEHRPSTTVLHLTRCCAALVASCQDMLFSLSSESVSRLHEFLGRPLFLFPCGFQRRAWRVVLDGGFLSVCPIQRHFLCLIWTSICCCLVVKLFSIGLHYRFFQAI